MTHQDSGERCLVAHFAGPILNAEGEFTPAPLLPACIKCTTCKAWLRPDEFEQTDCVTLTVATA